MLTERNVTGVNNTVSVKN